jgi:hypothetical protein
MQNLGRETYYKPWKTMVTTMTVNGIDSRLCPMAGFGTEQCSTFKFYY